MADIHRKLDEFEVKILKTFAIHHPFSFESVEYFYRRHNSYDKLTIAIKEAIQNAYTLEYVSDVMYQVDKS